MDIRVCRGCLVSENNKKFTSIFEHKAKLAQFIFELTNLKIPNVKQSSALLCTKCVRELKRAISIRNSIIKNHKNFSEFHSIPDPLRGRLHLKTDDLESISISNSETPIDINDLKNSEVNVAVIKEEPTDYETDIKEEFPGSTSFDDSISDEIPLSLSVKNFTKPKLNDESQQVKTFLCQRCGQIAENTCKVCKTKVIPKHEVDKIKQRERIIQTYLANPTIKSMTKLSRLADAPRTTVRRTIDCYKRNEIRVRKAGSGRKPGTGDQEREEKIIEAFKMNPELSIRQLGKMFGTCPSNVQKIKARHGFICEKKKGAKEKKGNKFHMDDIGSKNLRFEI